ncbi:MAG: LytR/AlgR family response regulator transcription factor [Gammaproteobacteria bacterium]
MTQPLYNVLVVDDEAPARGRLKRLLDEFEQYSCVGEANNGLQALELAGELQPHILLMDIRMPGMDGIEATRHLSELESPPAVIFTTAYNEYAVDAFDAQAIAYLMKPVRREKLERALEHASRLTHRQLDTLATEASTNVPRTHLSARIGDRLRLIPWDDIRYFQADQKYVSIGLEDEEILIDDSLKSLEEEFGEQVFRIHRNALVVVRHLHALERQPDGSQQVLIDGGKKSLAVSRRHVARIRKLIKSNQR